MRIKQIEYSKLRTDTDGFHNEKVGVIVELHEGESEFQAFDRAKRWVDARLKILTSGPTEHEVERAREVLRLHDEADNKLADPF